jgi:serine/threonine protein kinase
MKFFSGYGTSLPLTMHGLPTRTWAPHMYTTPPASLGARAAPAMPYGFTPGYAAPEYLGVLCATTKSGLRLAHVACYGPGREVDWWTLGCTMYMTMTGCMLFSQKTDLLDYVDRYKAHTGESMASLAMFNVKERDRGYLTMNLFFSAKACRRRKNRRSRMKIECFPTCWPGFQHLSTPFSQRCRTSSRISSTNRTRISLKGVYRPEKPKMKG